MWNIPPDFKGACQAGMDFSGLTFEKWNKHNISIVYNSYYQWVPLFLIIVAFVFYLPRMFWLIMEGGLMEFFGKGTTTRFVDDQEEKKDILVEFFRKNVHNKYNIYFWGFITMEAFNWLIVIILFPLTNVFLHGKFGRYGVHVLNYYRLPEEEQRETKNPMCDTFPRIASCDYWRWGAGGRQENINAICVLALNMINDKVFLIIWWWFLFLAIVGGLRLFYRGAQIYSATLRFQLINMRMNRYFKRSHKITKIENYLNNCKLGDWFVLYQLSKNLNRPFFMDFLTTLSVRYAHGHVCDEEDPEDEGPLLKQMDNYLKPSAKLAKCKKEIAEDGGDNLLEMVTQPKIIDEVDGEDEKKKKKEESEDDDDDDDDEGDEEEDGDKEKKSKKKTRRSVGLDDDDGDDGRLDLPDGDGEGIFSSRKSGDNGDLKQQTKGTKSQGGKGKKK